ncbi:hypothetical protein E4U54_007602 [Claviceps lovelessii]|nr:hypothetical protein E4U54_007602 [Claviceps lovelessii]
MTDATSQVLPARSGAASQLSSAQLSSAQGDAHKRRQKRPESTRSDPKRPQATPRNPIVPDQISGQSFVLLCLPSETRVVARA